MIGPIASVLAKALGRSIGLQLAKMLKAKRLQLRKEEEQGKMKYEVQMAESDGRHKPPTITLPSGRPHWYWKNGRLFLEFSQ